MLTSDELTSMRATAADALPDTAVIQMRTRTDNSGGGASSVWTAAGTVDCRLAPMRGDEREIADRVAEDADFLVTLPVSAAVTTQSRVLINGGTYNVAAIRDRSWEITQRIEVTKEV